MTTPTLTDRQRQAVRRWKLGHHAFHLYLLAMNTELPQAQEHLRSHRWEDLVATFRRLTVLYDAATASMKYAADFDPREYESLIRPSMSPPFLSPGFSGEQNDDHAVMLDLMRQTRVAVKDVLRHPGQEPVPQEVRDAAQHLWAAQSRNRRHHMLVCDKFVPDGGSLLKDYFASESPAEDESDPERPEGAP